MNDLGRARARLMGSTACRGIGLAALFGLAGQAAAQDVIPDGRTNTTVTVSGLVSDVRTGTVSGGVGVNTLRQLNASAGRTVNIHVPEGADTTLNLVSDRASRIDGTLNSVMNGTIGGTMIVANPNGVIVGAGGQINAGGLSVSTPTRDFVENFVRPDGSIDTGARDALIEGTAGLAPGDIVVDGAVTARDVALRAGGNILVGGTIDVGARAALVGAFANTGSGGLVAEAAGDIVVGGTVTARDGSAGASVALTAGRDVTVSGRIDADGLDGANAGRIDILAARHATVGQGASVTATSIGGGDGGDVHFSGLKTVTVIGELSAAAQGTGALGHLYIDPETLTISEDQLYAGQDTVLEASEAIYVLGGVTISTQNLYDPAAIDSYSPTLLGASGDLTLRAPVIDIGEGSRIIAKGGRGFGFATFYDGGSVLIEAVADQTLDTAGIARASTSITLGNGVEVIGADVTIRARATAGFAITEVAEVDAFAADPLNSSVTDLINDAAAYLTGELVSIGATVLPARAEARATIQSNAARIESDLGDVTIEALATTDVAITPEGNMLSVIGVSTDTQATVTFGASVVNNYDYGVSFGNRQDLRSNNNLTIRAIAQETQSLSARAEGAAATAAIVSQRDSAARVTTESAYSAFSGQIEPWVELSGGGSIVAETRHDLDFDAVAANGGTSGLALAGVVSLGSSEAITAGAFRTTAAMELRGETVWTRYDVDARGTSGTADDLTGATQARDATADEQADIAEGAAAVETLGDQDGDGGGSVGGAANLTGGFVLTLHDDISAAGLGGIELTGPDFRTFGTEGGSYSSLYDFGIDGTDVTITARTRMEDVDVSAISESDGATGIALAGTIADWGVDTLAQIQDTDLETSGAVTLLAETVLSGGAESGTLDTARTAIGAGAAGGTVASTAGLPDLDGLVAADAMTFSANASGSGSGLSGAVTAAVTTLDLSTSATVAETAGLRGPYDYEGGYGYGDGYGNYVPRLEALSRFSQTARNAGAVVTRANDPARAGAGAATGIGAGVAVSDITARAVASNRGNITTFGLAVDAAQALDIFTLASAGAGGGTVDLAGALALTRYGAQTDAWLVPGLGEYRHDPDMPEADRPEGGALRIRATDSSDLVTVAGALTGDATVGIGASAAITILDRRTRAALGFPDDAAYVGTGPYAGSSPVFSRAFAAQVDADGFSVAARTDGMVITAASAGTRPDGAAQGETRAAPATVGGVSLADADLDEENVQTGEEDNPAEDTRAGFTLSGAYAGTFGDSLTSAYLGHDGIGRLDGDFTVQAEDAADVLTLTGASVPGDVTVGMAGAMAHDSLARRVATSLVGGGWTADGFTGRAALSGRSLVIAGGAGGEGGGALGLAGALALQSGSRTALLDIGAIEMRLGQGTARLEASDSGEITTVAGAAQETADAAVGIGAAVALDRSSQTLAIETKPYADPGDAADEYALPPRGAIIVAAADLQVNASASGTRSVVARSSGAATGLAASGSAALRTGTGTASIQLDSDMALAAPATIRASLAGDSVVMAGSTASGAAVGVGVAFALQAEERDSRITLGAARIGGADTSSDVTGAAQAVSLVAESSGAMRAEAIAGTAAPEPDGDAAADGEEGGGVFAFNGSVALVTGSDTASILADEDGYGATRIDAASLALTANAGTDMVARAGGLTQAGEGIGAGLGSALLETDSASVIALRGLRVEAAGDIDVTARTDGRLDAHAVNGSEQGFVNVGVNVAGGRTDVGSRIAFGDLSQTPDDGDLLRGGDVTLRAETVNAHSATASAAAPVGEDGSASVNVGLAGFALGGRSAIELGGGDIQASGAISIIADTRPTVSASSLGADNLRLDFATNEAQGEQEGEADGGFNLGIAASLSDIDLDAAITVRSTDIRSSSLSASDHVTVRAESDVTSSTAGLVDSSASVDVRENAYILGPVLRLDAISRSGVRVDGTVGETNYGADARADEQANADLVDDAGAAARGDEAERTAFSASISPEAAASAARVDILNGIVGATVGDADIGSEATTDITLGATDAPISVVIAISEVSADTRITDSAVGAQGNLTIGARAVEDHSLSARVGAGDASAVDAAAVVSIRRSRATAIVDNDAAGAGLFGDVVRVDAATDRTLTFDADAVAGDDTFLAMAGNIGFGEGLTSAALGGTVARADGTAADRVVVDATATTTLDVATRAAGGRTTAAPEDETDKGGSGGVGARLAALGDDVNEDAGTEADDGTGGASGEAEAEGKLADAVRLAGAVTVLRQQDVTHATLGGSAMDADGTDLALGTTTVSAADMDVTANTTLAGMKIRTNAFLGEREQGDPNGVGISAALGYVALDFDTRAFLGQNATVTAGRTDVVATTSLDPDANTDRAAALRGIGEGADADDTFETTPNNSAPSLNGDIADDDWSISQGAAAAGEDVSVGVEAGIVNVDLNTSALIAGDVIGSASATARTLRGLSAEVGRPTYLAGTDGAGVGIGGAVAITAWDERTRADIVSTASITGAAEAGAESAARLATLASSKGAASSVGVNGALAILSLDRDVQAAVDPGASLTGALSISAADRTQSVTAALAQTTGEGVTIGASAALAFDDSRVQAVFGTLGADGIVGGGAIGADSAITTLDITATDSSIRALSAASGSGPEADDGETETAWGVGTVLGQDLDTEQAEALSGETEDTAGSGEAGYGLGISGAFALDFGGSRVEAASVASGAIASGDVTIAATANGLSTTATGAMVEGADTNGIAGAASIGLRDRAVSARLQGMDQSGTGTVDIRAAATDTKRTLAAGQQGRSEADFRIAGSAALNLGGTSVLTHLGENDIRGERSLIATARSGGEITALAGVRQQGGGTSVGVSFALDEHDTDATVELLGTPGADGEEAGDIVHTVEIQSATITATTDETRIAKAQTGALALPDADTGVSVAVAAALVTASSSGTVSLHDQHLTLRGDSTVEAIGGGTTQATAIQLQASAGEQPRIGGAAALVTGTRDLALSADDGFVSMTGGTLTGGARDAGRTASAIEVLTAGQGTGVAASSALTLGRGAVVVSLGSATPTGEARFGLLSADTAQAGLIDLTASDLRDYDAASGALALQSGGAQVGVGTATTIDSRVVAAEARDIVLMGDGAIGLNARRGGALTARSAAGGLNASGAAINVSGATVVAGGSVTADMLGARSFLGAGAVSVTASDTGLVAARMLDMGFSSNTSVGAQALGAVLRRDVRATVDVSDTQVSALTHAVTVAADAASRIEAQALSANVASTAGITATYRMLTADRDTSATLGGGLSVPDATVTATRADALDTLAVDVAVSGGTAVGAKFTLIQQGGGTTAQFGPLAGSEVAGAVTVAASDTSTISADSYAANVGSTVGAFGEGVLVILGGDGTTADPSREGELSREEEADLDALRAASDAATQRLHAAGTQEAPEAGTLQPLQAMLGDGLVAARLDLAGTGDVTLGSLDMDASVATGTVTRVGTVGVGGTAAAGAVAAMGIARTQALVDLDTAALQGTLRVGGGVDLRAANTGDLSITSVGVAVGGTAGATGSFAMALDRRRSGISLDDATIEAGSLSATAITSGEATARGLIAAVGGTVGAGAGVALSLDDRDTLVTADRATIDVLSGDLTLAASGGADTFALATAGAAGGTAGVGASLALARQNSDTAATVEGSSFTASGDITIQAVQAEEAGVAGSARPRVTAISLPLGVGGTAGVAAGVGIALKSGTTEALVRNSTLAAQDDVAVRARSDADIDAIGIGVAAGGAVGVTGSLSVIRRDDLTRARIADGTVTARDSVAVEALVQTGAGASGGEMIDASSLGVEFGGAGVNIAAGGTAGVGITVAVPVLRNTVEASIGGGASVTGRGYAPLSGGDIGAPIRLRSAAATETDAAAETTGPMIRGLQRGVSVSADSAISHAATAVTIGVGAKAGIAGQVGVVSVEDTVLARIGDETGDRTTVTTESTSADIILQAAGSLALRTSAVAGGAGVAAGVGGSSTTILTARDITAETIRADLNSGDDIEIAALAADRVSTSDFAGGIAKFAGIGGAVTVVSGETRVRARLDRAALDARDDVSIRALLDRDMSLDTRSVGGGIAAVAGSVLVFDATDSAEIELVDGSAADHVTIAGDAVRLNAELALAVDLDAASFGGGIVAVQGTVVTGFADTTSRVAVGRNARIGTAQQGAGSIDIDAAQTIGPRQGQDGMVDTGAISIGVATLGGTVSVLSSNAVTEAVVDRDAQLHANGTIAIDSLTRRDLGASAHSLQVGLGGAFQGIVSQIVVGSPAEGSDAATLAAAGQSLSQDDVLVQDNDGTQQSILAQGQSGTTEAQEVTARRSAVGAKLAGVDASVPQARADRTVTRIGAGARIVAGGALSVTATDRTDAEARAGGIGISGAIAATAGRAAVTLDNTVTTEIGANAVLSSGGMASIGAYNGTANDLSTVRAEGFAGAFSAQLSAALAASDATLRGDTLLRIHDGASITAATLAAEAETHIAATTAADGISGALLGAASGLSASITDGGRTRILLGGADLTADTLRVEALSAGARTATVDAFGIALGAAGAVLSAGIKDRSSVTLDLDGTEVTADDADLSAEARASATTRAHGLTLAGLAAGGISDAETDVQRIVRVESDDTARFAGGSVALSATQAGSLDATGQSGLGAIGLAASGSRAATTRGGTVEATLGGSLALDGDATVRSIQNGLTRATADSTAIGLLGSGGAANAQVTAAVTSSATLNATGTAASGLVGAITDEDLRVRAEGDSGGLGTVGRTVAELSSTSDSVAVIGSAAGLLELGRLSALGDHRTLYSAEADSSAISAIGRATATAAASLSTDSGVRVADNARIEAGDIDLRARTDLVRRGGQGATVTGGSGGGVGATGVRATSDIDLDGFVTIGTGARLTQTGSIGGVAIDVASRAEAVSAASVSTVEAASLPRAATDSTVTNDATVTLGRNARIDAGGDVGISTGTTGAAQADASVHTVAAGSRITTEAHADYDASDRIVLETGSVLAGDGNVSLATGTGGYGVRSATAIARAGYRSDSFVPLDRAPVSGARSDLVSTITARGAIEAGGTVDLRTERGTASITAQAIGKNLWRETAEGVINYVGDIVGADDVDLDIIGTQDRILTEDTGVTVVAGGAIRSGLAASIDIHVNANGQLTDGLNGPVLTDTDGLPVSISEVSVATLRLITLIPLHRQRAAYEAEGNDNAVSLIDIQIAEVEAQLAVLEQDLGGAPVRLVILDDLDIEGSDINIDGGYLDGGGILAPSTDAGVRLDIDDATAAVYLRDISIPDRPGSVRLNGVAVRSNGGVGDVNRFDANEARGRITTSGLSSFTTATNAHLVPGLIFENPGANSGGIDVDAIGSIFAFGDLTNRSGSVSLNSTTGNILLQGNLVAASAQITAAQGNVIVGFVDGLRNAGGDPAAAAMAELERIEANGTQALVALITPDDLTQDATGIQANNVSIYGEWVNVNARIEAGLPEATVSIGARTDTIIAQSIAPQMGGSGRVLIFDPLDPLQPDMDITGNLPVWLNAETGALEIDRAVATGGQVRIAGAIMSTGGGEIAVLDGYSRIDIQSESFRTLQLGALDTGGAEGVRGRVEFIDTRFVVNGNATDALDRFRVTTYEGTDGANPFGFRDILVTRNGQQSRIDNRFGQAQASYGIDAVNGRVPYLVYDVLTNRQPQNTTDINDRQVQDAHVEDRVAGAFYTYSNRAEASFGYLGQRHTHGFRADAPIAIELMGARTGEISVAHRGDIALTDRVTNVGGAVHIGSDLGGIVGTTADALVHGYNISLDAGFAGDITGQSGTSLQVNHDNTSTGGGSLYLFDAQARGGDVRIEARSSGLNIGQVRGEAVELRALGNITNGFGFNGQEADVVSSSGLTLVSRTGRIGRIASFGQQNDDLHIETGTGLLNATAQGDIGLTHARFGNPDQIVLNLDRVESRTGNVSIHTSGRMVDANDNDVLDILAEEAALRAFWQQVGLIDENGSTNAERVALEIEAEKARQRTALAFYREVESVQGVAYDPTFDGALTVAESQALAADGFTAEMIAAEQTRRVALYHDGRALALANPGATAQTLVPTLSAARIAEIQDTFGLDFSRDLDIGLRRDLVVAASDTELEIEEANVAAAGFVHLFAQNIGEDRVLGTVITDASQYSIGLGQVWNLRNGAPIPRSLLVALATAERDDIQRVGHPINIVRILGQDDIDVSAGTQQVGGGVVAWAGQADDPRDTLAFIGSEGDILVDSIRATDRTRVKAGGAILSRLAANGSVSTQTHVSGERVVLEAAGGSIGDSVQQINLAGPVGATITLDARATEAVHIGRQAVGDIAIASLRADNGAARIVANGGSIRAASDAGDGTLRAASVDLTATGDIAGGLRIAATDTTHPTRIEAGGIIDLTIEGDMTARSIRAGGDIALNIENGDLTLDGQRSPFSGLQIAPVIFTPGDLTLRADEGAILDGGSDLPTANGDVLQDIEADRLNLFTQGFGTSANAVETRVASLWGSSAGTGAWLANRGDLTVRGFGTEAQADGHISAAGHDLTFDITGRTRGRNLTYSAYNIFVDRYFDASGSSYGHEGNLELDAANTLLLRQQRRGDGSLIPWGTDISTLGDLTLSGFDVTVENADAPLNLIARHDGLFRATGTLTVTAGNSLDARQLRGRDVIVTGGGAFTQGQFGPKEIVVDINAGRIVGSRDVTVSATGDIATPLVIAGRDAILHAGNLIAVDEVRADSVDLRGIGFAGSRLDLDVAALSGRFTSTSPGQTIRLDAPATEIRGFDWGSVWDTLTIDALGTDVTFADGVNGPVTTGALDLTAQSVTVSGTLEGSDITIRSLNDIDVTATGAILGWGVDLSAGLAVPPDFPTARSADIVVADGGRIVARGNNAVSLQATNAIRASGIVSERSSAGDAIVIIADILRAGGAGYAHLTANGTGAVTRIVAGSSEVRQDAPLRTAVNILDAQADRGTLAIREADTIRVTRLAASQGAIDLVAGGDISLEGNGTATPVVRSAPGEHVILTAVGSLWTDTNGGPVTVEAGEVHLRALTGSIGTEAQRFDLDLDGPRRGGVVSMAAERHIVANLTGPISDMPLLMSRSGVVRVMSQPVQVSRFGSAGRDDLDGPDMSNATLRGPVSLLPVVTPVVEQAIYPVWFLETGEGSDDNGQPIFDETGLDLTFIDYTPPTGGGGDGEGGEGGGDGGGGDGSGGGDGGGGGGGDRPPLGPEERDRIDQFLSQLGLSGRDPAEINGPGPHIFFKETPAERRARLEEQRRLSEQERGGTGEGDDERAEKDEEKDDEQGNTGIVVRFDLSAFRR